MNQIRPGSAAEGRATNLVLVGVSHRSATVAELELLGKGQPDQIEILDTLRRSSQVREAMVLSTCNRFEVYAVVESIAEGLFAIRHLLAEHIGTTIENFTETAYTRQGDAAARHLFRVACGLESAVTGDQQVLGQVRRAYATADARHTVGSVLHRLVQRTLAAGKRVRAETEIGAAGASAVTAALSLAGEILVSAGADGTFEGKTAVVIGTGAMGTLAAAHLTHAGCARIYVLSRTLSRGRSLATRIRETGSRAEAFTLDLLPAALANADIVITGTSTAEPVVSVAHVRAAAVPRRGRAPQLVICDIGMPRNVDPAVAALPGVSVIDMDRICRESRATEGVEAASRIVAAEVSGYLAEQRMDEVVPTITALHRRAADVVAAELSRLDNRLPELGCAYRDEMARTVRRVVDKLLHPPTAQIRSLASTPAGASYAEALRELFELDHADTEVVLR